MMSTIEEEKELTEIAGDFSMSTSNNYKGKQSPLEVIVEMNNDSTHMQTDMHN